MGRHCGFYFYILKDGNLEKANVVNNPCLEDDENLGSWLQIDGRCDATTIFLNLIRSKEPNAEWFEVRKLEDRYTPYLLLNHPELDGHKEKTELLEIHGEKYEGWLNKYFYVGLEKFKAQFEFEEVERLHNHWIENYENEIVEYQKEIENLKIHQERSMTKAAFDGFQKEINKLKKEISETRLNICEAKEDYGYEHYQTIKKYIELIEETISNNPDVIVVAFAND